MKKCAACRIEKDSSDFYANNSSKDRLGFYCIPCVKQKAAEWRKNHKGHRLEYNRKWRTANPGKYQEILSKHSTKNRSVLYGISKQDFDSMLSAQGGMCAFGHDFCGSRICVDHDHKTGKVRGLLCTKHNLALGLFDDSLDGLMAAVGYLSQSAGAPK